VIPSLFAIHIASAQTKSDAPPSVTSLEDAALAELKKKGVAGKFVIKAFKPEGYMDEITRFTVSQPKGPKGEYSFRTEHKKDIMVSGGGMYAIGVHRFDGSVRIHNYTFVSSGDKDNRLTFALMEQGYVYLRGKGKVVAPNGTATELGTTQ
jgi:hypothetical protein